VLEAASYAAITVYYKMSHGGSEPFFDNMKRYGHPVIGRLFFLGKYNRPNGFIDSNAVFAYDPYTRYSPVPGMSYSGVLGRYRTSYFHNKDGFVDISPDRSVPKRKSPGEFRVFLLGGSTAMGVGAETMSQTISGYLEKELKDRFPGRDIRVVNAAVGGFNSFQEYMYLIVKVSEYSPDLIVTFDGTNDADDASVCIESNEAPGPYSYGQAGRINKHNLLLPGGTARYLMAQLISYLGRIEDYSYFVYGANQFLRKYRPASLPGGNGAGPSSAERDGLPQEAIRYYTENLRNIIRYDLSRGYLTFCVLQPHIYHGRKTLSEEEKPLYKPEGKELFIRVFDSFSGSFGHLAEEYGHNNEVLIRDYSDIFRDTPSEIYIDGTHYNKTGNLIIARRMADDISRAFGDRIRQG
jgi:lysophospholipase L1-like esterase